MCSSFLTLLASPDYIQVLLPLLLLFCVVMLLLLLHQLLLFVIVCRTAKIVVGSLNLIPSIALFVFILEHDLLLMYVPLGSVGAFTAPICPYYILGNYGHARSEDGRHPAAANSSL